MKVRISARTPYVETTMPGNEEASGREWDMAGVVRMATDEIERRRLGDKIVATTGEAAVPPS